MQAWKRSQVKLGSREEEGYLYSWRIRFPPTLDQKMPNKEKKGVRTPKEAAREPKQEGIGPS